MTLKTAIVTGAGTGIGKAIAKGLVADGFKVALVGRREQVLSETATAIDPDGQSTMVLAADIGKPEAVNALFDKVVETWGRLDLLVNNAGINAPGVPLEDITPEQWLAVVDVNLNGAFYCTQAAFRIFKAQSPRGGRIINNGSISASTPRPQSSPYAATKHAISGLTK
jgi:NAD(P)-dependent dehydrogenase (short-subunit alcohol dehydrogenase family)